MSTQPIPLEGYAYRNGDQVTVFARLANGKYVMMTGDATKAKRHWGRFTRPSTLKRPPSAAVTSV